MNPPEAPQKSFSSRHPVLTTILIGTPIILFISAIGSNGSSNSNYAAPSAPSTQVAGTETNTTPTHLLALKSVRYYRDALNEPCANGEVVNISNQSLGFVQANIQFRDKNGSLVTPDQTYLSVDSLPPSQSATFDDCAISSDGAVLAQTTLSFTGRVGNSLTDDNVAYEDDTKQAPSSATPETTTGQPTPATAPASSPPAPTPTNVKDNWSSYADTGFQTILNDPGYYLGGKVKVTGVVFDFLGEGGRGGTENYIEVAPLGKLSSPTSRIMLQVDSSANYLTATQRLNTWESMSAGGGNLADGIVVYGTVQNSADFSLTSGGDVSYPVIEITRLDQCSDFACDAGATSVFPAGLTTTGAHTSGNSTQTQATVQKTASSNPRYFQLNVTGVCQNAGNGTVILMGYPMTSDYSIPTDDIDAWYEGDVAFTVPSSVPTGTFQVTVRGYNPGVGFCSDVSGGSITIQ